VPFGVPHPLTAYLEPQHFAWLGAYMILSLVLSVAVSVHACRAAHLRRLRPLAPLVEFYYTLGTFAAWIGALDLMARPFFWAKTRHGVYGGLGANCRSRTRMNPRNDGKGLTVQALRPLPSGAPRRRSTGDP
jgi:hypothetical protein